MPDPADGWLDTARAVLAHYGLTPARLERVTQGLINLTVCVTTPPGERFALQRLHHVFAPSVNDNIDRVTAHLAGRGLQTPRLVRTRGGESGVIDEPDGACWRLLTWIDGTAFDHLVGAGQARQAGQLLARFHRALEDFDRPLAGERAVAHDIERHLAQLQGMLAEHPAHRLAAKVGDLHAQLAAAVARLPEVPTGRARVLHGDPKISNLLFDRGSGEALCLIDLDTLCRAPIGFELGDAMRSWCNPHAEDSPASTFDLDLFSAAIEAYLGAAEGFLDRAERAAIVDNTLLIYYELAARFLADALDERYFAWDAARYPGRGEHNLARGRGQLAAAAALAAKRGEAEARVRRAVG